MNDVRILSPASMSKGIFTGLGRRRSSLLLVFGILSSLLYVAMLTFVPLRWEGYSSAAQTVSELSAIDAPTRLLWVPLGILWTLLYALFGWGVWKAAGWSGRSRYRRPR